MVLNTIKYFLVFLIGPISPTLTTAICFCLAACIARIIQQGFNWRTLSKITKRILSYFFFLLVANRMDVMGLNMLLGWQGTTQLLVAAWIAVTEVKNIFLLVKQFGEVEPPIIISERLNQMQLGQLTSLAGYVDSQSIDEQIKNLKAHMDQLNEWAQLAQNVAANSQTTAIFVPPPLEPVIPAPNTPDQSKTDHSTIIKGGI